MYRGEYGRERWQNEKLDGWKIVAFATPAGGDRDFWKAQADVYLETIRERGPDPLAAHALAHAGASRVHSMADLREGAGGEGEGEWIDEHLARQDVGERIVGVYHLSPETESYLLVGRAPGETAFTQDDAARLFRLLVDFPRVHDWLALERGLVAPSERPLSPRERDVSRALLGPESEQEIADRLGVSRGTAHNYVVDIFRCFGVRSRHELVQLWLADLTVGDGHG